MPIHLDRLPLLGSIRGRLMGLLAIAAVPLVAMAAIAAWQNYQSSIGQARQAVRIARESVFARHAAMIETVRQNLLVIAQSDTLLDPTECTPYLTRILADSRGAYDTLLARSTTHTACFATNAGPLSARLFPDAVDGFQVSLRSALPGVAVASVPIVRDGVPKGIVSAAWRVDRYIGRLPISAPVSVWLMDGAGDVIPVQNADAALLPERSLLAALMSDERVDAEGPTASGGSFAYVTGTLPDGWRVLVGIDAGPVLASARALLLARFIETAVLLLIGLFAVGVGVNGAVVEPVKNLTRAVRNWRGGASFTPGSLTGVPAEVAELSVSFAQATSKLAEREVQLRNAITHQDLLMHEIHHRVKNNLQIVASLLNLQASRIRQPEAKAEFQSARDRIRALATLHRHLYAEGEFHAINMRSFLTELCDQLFQAFGEVEGDRIRIEIEAPELSMSSDQSVPLALIVTEIVSNALKYAFPNGRRGTISVRLLKEPEVVRLVIQDDGIGLPAGRTETETGVRDGIGIQLIRGFARQLSARLMVEVGEGTRYDVAIPFRADADPKHHPAPQERVTA